MHVQQHDDDGDDNDFANDDDGDDDDFGDDDDGDVKLYEICDDDLEAIN